MTEQTCIADIQRPLSTSGKNTRIPWFISFPTSILLGLIGRTTGEILACLQDHFRDPYGEHLCHSLTHTHTHTHTTHRFKPSSCFKILQIDSHRMCRASARARAVKCQSSSITSAMVLMLVTITTVHSAPPRSLNSADSRPSTKALCHHRIIESPNVSFPNASFNNAVVSLGIFLKRTQNLIAQRCSSNTSIFSEYSATHCLVIHEYSVSYPRFFFFFRVYCCTDLLLHSRVFYYPRKSVFPLSTCTIVRHRGTSTCFQVSYISPLVRRITVCVCSLQS